MSLASMRNRLRIIRTTAATVTPARTHVLRTAALPATALELRHLDKAEREAPRVRIFRSAVEKAPRVNDDVRRIEARPAHARWDGECRSAREELVDEGRRCFVAGELDAAVVIYAGRAFMRAARLRRAGSGSGSGGLSALVKIAVGTFASVAASAAAGCVGGCSVQGCNRREQRVVSVSAVLCNRRA